MQLKLTLFLILWPLMARAQMSNQTANQTPEGRLLPGKLRPDTVIHAYLQDDIFTEENENRIRLYIHDVDKLGKDEDDTLTDSLKYLALGRVQTALYNSILMHRYDNYQDLLRSGGPEVNQERCLYQVKQMIDRFTLFRNNQSASKDAAIQMLFDTFGRISSGLRGGSIIWAGRYQDCINTKLSIGKEKQSMRYCAAALRNVNWSSMGRLDEILAVEAGVCLPKTCDSLDYKNKYKLVEKLLHINDHEFKLRGLSVSNLYCLPDEESELRQWWRSPKARMIVCATSLWFCLIIVATFSYERVEHKKRQNTDEKSQPSSTLNRIFDALSLTRNIKILLSLKRVELDTKQKQDKSSKARSKMLDIDLRSLDGIKVLCMLCIIIAHILLCFTLLMKNGQDFLTGNLMIIYLPQMLPFFAVNAFFVISGLLTSYIIFRENRSYNFLNKLSNWPFLIIYRYLRVLPAYLFTALFIKHVCKFLGSGPFWDYGTSSLALKYLYEKQSIGRVFLIASNFKPIFEHCVSSAWYLANDFQFFLVTPIFITLLHRAPKFGQLFTKICMALGWLATVVTMWTYNIDFRSLVNHDVQSVIYIITFMHKPYTYPVYRIPSYLMGLLFGYKLFRFAEAKARFAASVDKTYRGPRWSEKLVKYGPTISLLIIIVQLFLPACNSRLTVSKFAAQMIFSIMFPTGHLLLAWSVGSYILLAATGNGNKSINNFLSSPLWKPLARLSLCSLLVQMEVTNYFFQISGEMQDFSTSFYAAQSLLIIVVSYLVASVLYLIIEAPIKNLLSIFISHVTSLQQAAKGSNEAESAKKDIRVSLKED